MKILKQFNAVMAFSLLLCWITFPIIAFFSIIPAIVIVNIWIYGNAVCLSIALSGYIKNKFKPRTPSIQLGLLIFGGVGLVAYGVPIVSSVQIDRLKVNDRTLSTPTAAANLRLILPASNTFLFSPDCSRLCMRLLLGNHVRSVTIEQSNASPIGGSTVSIRTYVLERRIGCAIDSNLLPKSRKFPMLDAAGVCLRSAPALRTFDLTIAHSKNSKSSHIGYMVGKPRFEQFRATKHIANGDQLVDQRTRVSGPLSTPFRISYRVSSGAPTNLYSVRDRSQPLKEFPTDLQTYSERVLGISLAPLKDLEHKALEVHWPRLLKEALDSTGQQKTYPIYLRKPILKKYLRRLIQEDQISQADKTISRLAIVAPGLDIAKSIRPTKTFLEWITRNDKFQVLLERATFNETAERESRNFDELLSKLPSSYLLQKAGVFTTGVSIDSVAGIPKLMSRMLLLGVYDPVWIDKFWIVAPKKGNESYYYNLNPSTKWAISAGCLLATREPERFAVRFRELFLQLKHLRRNSSLHQPAAKAVIGGMIRTGQKRFVTSYVRSQMPDATDLLKQIEAGVFVHETACFS